MATLGQAKTLGIIGSVLFVVAPLIALVFSLGGLLSIVGLILMIFAVKYISDTYRDRSIYNNIVYFFAVLVTGVLAFSAITGVSLFNVLANRGTSLSENQLISAVSSVFGVLIIGFIVLYIAWVVSALFLRRSFLGIADRTNVGLFKTSSFLFLIGAALVIIIIGIIIIWIAWILFIVAFAGLPQDSTATPAPAMPPYTPPTPPPPPPLPPVTGP
jgi:uncharacterized membrane protein